MREMSSCEVAPMIPAPLVAPLFVLLWSTGFIGARLGLPYAEPMDFLGLRFVIAALVMALWVVLSGAPWPRGKQITHQALIGVLVQFVYLGGGFAALDWGGEAGTTALIARLQAGLDALLAARA